MTGVQLTPEQAKSIGELLKSAREKQAKNIADVAYQIALSPAQLRAIEAADLKPFYSPGFFYQAAERYARLLNVALPSFDTPTAPPVAETVAVVEPVVPEITPSEPIVVAHVTPGNLAAKKPLRWTPIALAASVAAIAVAVLINQQQTTKILSTDNAANASVAASPSASEAAVTAANSSATNQGATVGSAAASGPQTTAASVTTQNTTPAAKADSSGSEKPDSLLESAGTAWVQIVKKNGEKSNLKIEPGQKIEFASMNTAAIVFGQPDKAKLLVKGKTVDINRFVTPDNPSRALVILNQIP